MSEPPVDVVFSVHEEDLPKLLGELGQHPSLDPLVVRSAGAAGGGDLVTVLVPLIPPTLTFLAGVITSWVTRPRASIEIDKTKIKASGISERAVEDMLRSQLLQGPANASEADKATK